MQPSSTWYPSLYRIAQWGPSLPAGLDVGPWLHRRARAMVCRRPSGTASGGAMSSTWSVAAWVVIASALTARGAEAPASQDEILAALEAYAQTAQQQWSVPGLAIAVVK